MTLQQYQNRKEALLELIREHNENCMRYLDYETVKNMKIEQLEQIYNYDDQMVDVYSQELLLLEAKWQLGNERHRNNRTVTTLRKAKECQETWLFKGL